jgi:hypothetical protein
VTGTRGIAEHLNLADGQEGGDALGLGFQVGHLAAGRHPDPELLAGSGEAAAADAGDAVVGGG